MQQALDCVDAILVALQVVGYVTRCEGKAVAGLEILLVDTTRSELTGERLGLRRKKGSFEAALTDSMMSTWSSFSFQLYERIMGSSSSGLASTYVFTSSGVVRHESQSSGDWA